MKADFFKMAQDNRGKARAWINQEGLRFTTLYTLLPEINSLNFYEELSLRNKAAFIMCAAAQSEQGCLNCVKEHLDVSDEIIRSVLKWMVLTGARDDGLDDEFDRILDITAAHLIRTYGDLSILPGLVQIVFRRNRRGRYVHDLIWTLYSAHDTRVLRLIAEYLRSSDSKDVHLAGKLLKFDADENIGGVNEKKRDYAKYITWYRDNLPYLYFTDQGFHQTSEPIPCGVDLGAKYLCKKNPPHDSNLLNNISDEEHSRLDEFYEMENEERLTLANFSHHLHQRDKARWSKWMGYSREEKLKIARTGFGGAV
jgi:alkylhydroperoxidase family enzyme